MTIDWKRVGTLVLLLAACSARSAQDGRPNILMIVVDDMRTDEFGAGGHPYLETPNIDRLAENGAMFTNAYHATPLCSPNRASILTGQFVSRHGILDNTSRSHASHQLDLFPKKLQEAGYRTAHVGKWHMGNDPTPRPGYDYWVSFAGQGKTNDPVLFEGGELRQTEGYITDIFTDRAVDFIRKARHDEVPFFVYIGHKAVHPEAVQRDDGTVDRSTPMEFIPAERHMGRYDDEVVDRSPSVDAATARREKPVLARALRERAELVERDPTWEVWMDPGVSEKTIQRRAEMMLSVDESVGRLVGVLEESGILDNTLIVFTSDNGYFYGEHGLSVERRLPYQESIQTPVLIQYPEKVDGGRAIDGLVLSVDYAATVLDAAGVGVPEHVQGKSLMPVLTGGSGKVREVAYIEFYSHENPFPWTARLDYRIVLDETWKYIRWIRFDERIGMELYDLNADPNELENLAYEADYEGVLSRLQLAMQQQSVVALGIADEPSAAE